MFGHMIEIHPSFRLHLTSEAQAPHFGPDVSTIVQMVNFYVTVEGLEAQMLSIVI